MNAVIVFYGGFIHMEFSSEISYKRWRNGCDQEIYNGAYAYFHKHHHPQWFRLDGTPVLLEDVPKELRTTVMLMS